MKEKSEIIIIAALSENRVIGKGGALPWSLPEDLRHFKALTLGCPCIMGRKTWESLPRRPLPGRENIVISATPGNHGQGAVVCPSLEAALLYAAPFPRIFICGGESVYTQAMPIAHRLELTVIHREYDGDARFPAIDPARWQETRREDHGDFSFLTFTRVLCG
jgi:dihydrofolate reductase